MILVDHRGADPDLLLPVLGEFLDRGIPATAMLDPLSDDIRHIDAIARIMGGYPLRGGGLLDLAALVPDGAAARRFGQMRLAGEMRDALAARLGPAAARQVVTLADPAAEDRIDLPAFRAAGFRVLLRPADEATAADFLGRGQLRLAGGTRLDLGAGPGPVVAALDDTLARGEGGLLTLSLAGIGTEAVGGARALAARIAARLEAGALAGTLHLTRPTDYLLQFGPSQLTETTLLLALGGTAGDAGLSDLALTLAGHDIAFALVAESPPDLLPPGAALLPRWTGAGDALPTGPVLLSAPLPEGALPPVGAVFCAGAARAGLTALRADGRLHVAVEDWAAQAGRDWPACESLALLIHPADAATPVQRAALLRRLHDLMSAGQTRFVTPETFAEQAIAADPLLTRMWSTLRRQVTDPPRPLRLALAERDRLREDARVAWTFIDRFTSPVTGLCAGTVLDGPGGRVNREATYWDLASQMQGILAAQHLGLIPRDEAAARLALMLDNLPQAELDGLSLPPAMFLTGERRAVVRPGFDSCDVGRFLLLLDRMVEGGLVAPARAAEVSAGWDLAHAIRDGHPLTHDGRRWLDTRLSHCTPYVAPAYAGIGLPLDSPWPPLGPTADARMALLDAVAAMGSLGTEPLLLQAIERGETAESRFLADVLFDAQLDWFETTGEPKCISEIPLDVAPWFSYQGLRVDRLGAEGWTILSPDPDPAFRTPEFRRGIELISAKSAYLWAAAHPHPYCDRLVGIIRDRGRIDGFGFSVGVYTATMRPMENYSDLNTNGIILGAIARMLAPDPARG